ncbi:hypothetical protein TNCV_147431 [Trichonephila clavipes]|nr:hypothetical protein TNCV_147431 [Trichonephila clavipes]
MILRIPIRGQPIETRSSGCVRDEGILGAEAFPDLTSLLVGLLCSHRSRPSINGHGVRIARLMVDNDESSTLTADLTVNLSYRSAVALGRSLPS